MHALGASARDFEEGQKYGTTQFFASCAVFYAR